MIKLDAGNVTRQDLILIDPENILAAGEANGRWQSDVNANADYDVATLVKSYENEGGQRTPVEVRRLADKRVQLVCGFRRHRAAMQYNKLHPESPMKLKCVVTTCNDEEMLRRNIVENHERKATTPIDDAHNHRRLRENHGWTDARIAELYHYSVPYVNQIKGLLDLSTEIQQKIHDKEMSVQAGLAVKDLPVVEQKEVVAPEVGMPVTSTPTTAVILERVREKKIAVGGRQARSMANVRKLLDRFTDSAEPQSVQDFGHLFLKYIKGVYTDDTMEKKMKELLVPKLAQAA